MPTRARLPLCTGGDNSNVSFGIIKTTVIVDMFLLWPGVS